MQRMIDPDRALALLLDSVVQTPLVDLALSDALGLVLGEEARADRDHPPFDRSARDGLAVLVADAGREVELVGLLGAGHSPTVSVSAGRAVEIMTGAPCPAGTEAVVMKEEVVQAQGRALLPARIEAGQHIAPKGSECRAGALLCPIGATVTPLVLAVLASLGRERVRARRFPRVAVISTGDELAQPGAAAGPAQIRESNGPMLVALVRRAGLPSSEVRRLHAGDTLDELARAIDEAGQAEMVVLSGGVSAGRFDLVPRALEVAGATLLLHRVTQKPGKPLLLARRGDQLCLGLPGNPLAAHLCFHRYVSPAIRAAIGRSTLPRRGRGVLAAALSTRDDRTLFVLARVEGDEGARRVTPLLGRGSADIFGTWSGNAYLRLAPGEHELTAGTELDFEWIDGEP